MRVLHRRPIRITTEKVLQKDFAERLRPEHRPEHILVAKFPAIEKYAQLPQMMVYWCVEPDRDAPNSLFVSSDSPEF